MSREVGIDQVRANAMAVLMASLPVAMRGIDTDVLVAMSSWAASAHFRGVKPTESDDSSDDRLRASPRREVWQNCPHRSPVADGAQSDYKGGQVRADAASTETAGTGASISGNVATVYGKLAAWALTLPSGGRWNTICILAGVAKRVWWQPFKSVLVVVVERPGKRVL